MPASISANAAAAARCMGLLGGMARRFFAALEAGDPHYIPSAEAKREQKRLERLERNRRRLDALLAVYQ